MIPRENALSVKDMWPQWMRCNLVALLRWRDLFEDDTPWYSFCDDVNGGGLNTDKVNDARKVELDWLHHHGVYVRRKVSEYLQHAGAKPTRKLWIHTNKGR